ncbi:NTP transferase domain-containing protein [Oxyplasma meridianum]|uniref:NTP transferase domain-containing protein n=1 Tax=Oxyplasma meridianum TaxID=3073602 RepID=A0AAX4NFX2_9ARCH
MKHFSQEIQFLIMAGGKGTRFGDAEKCMQIINEKSILENLIDSLRTVSDFISVSTTLFHRRTIELCRLKNISVIITDGNDYISDLRKSISMVNRIPTVVMGSDIYFTDLDMFRDLLVSLPEPSKPIIDLLQNNSFSGISVFTRIPERDAIMEYYEMNSEKSFSVNINTEEDLRMLKLEISRKTADHFL